jgi:hypothetical protein
MDTTDINERPRICCIDLQEETIAEFKKAAYNVHEGTLGAKIKVPNSFGNSHRLLLDYKFPTNLHEFDIIVMDLDNYNTKEYASKEHSKEGFTGQESFYLQSNYPETLFNSRPLSSHILKIRLSDILNRRYLIIVFSSESSDTQYQGVSVSSKGSKLLPEESHNIYSFAENVPTSRQILGKELKVSETPNRLQSLLEKYKKDTIYNQTFYHPSNEDALDKNFIPLMENMNNEIIGFYQSSAWQELIILPQIKDKTNFLLEFFDKIAPSIYPELFPSSTTFDWRTQKEYWLPEHSALLQEKSNIQKDYEAKLASCDAKIEANKEKYAFLHDILTETGDKLVTSIIEYLKWLGFDSVVDYDKHPSSTLPEEDIQVELSDGLLVIECKGVLGTSKDEDCSQVYKIKNRRCKERGKFDVFALYIVNHQRHLSPLNRRNPPFSAHQVQDAKNDERGLLSTWQLFNLYYDIEKGILTKEEARELILKDGIVDFRPKNLVFVSKPEEFYKDNKVCIVKIENLLLTVNDELLIEKNGRFEKAKIKAIQDNGTPISYASNGELGLELNKKIPNHCVLWKRN